MLGGIFGDIVGSVYEFHNIHDYDFVLLRNYSGPTDDSYMTLAVAKALMESWGKDDEVIRTCLVEEMQRIGRMYPDAGYGGPSPWVATVTRLLVWQVPSRKPITGCRKNIGRKR